MKTFTITIITFLLSWSLSAQLESEPNDSFGQANILPLVDQKGFIQGSINPIKDKDYYKIDLQSAGVLEINILDVPANIEMGLEIYNELQEKVTSKICDPGIYYIVLFDTGLSDFSPDLYNVKVNFNTDDQYECNDEFSNASLIGLNDNVYGSIYPNRDEDFYKIDLPSAGILEISILDVPSNIQMKYEIYNELQEKISSKICEDGIYYIVLFDTGLISSSPDLYNLRVDFNTDDQFECNDQFSDAADIGLNDDLYGSIYPDRDEDFYRIELPSAGILEISIMDVPSNIQMKHEIYNELQEKITSTICEAGTYYIVLFDTGLISSNPDLYNLRVDFNTDDIYECNYSFDNAYPINICDTIKAAIYTKNDQDFFSIDLEENKTVQFSLTDVSNDLKPTVNIFNSSQEKVYEKNSYYGTSQVFDFTPTETEQYYIMIEGSSNTSSSELYELLIKDENCDATFVESLDFNDISIFPNPITDIINIENQSQIQFISVNLINSNGELVKQSEMKNPTIDVSNEPPGVYFLLLRDQDGNSYTKKIINH